MAAINALMAAQHGSGATQGFGNAGFGGGSPSATVGGFGGNSSPTGAEGVSTAALGQSPGATQNAVNVANGFGQHAVGGNTAFGGSSRPSSPTPAPPGQTARNSGPYGARTAPAVAFPVLTTPWAKSALLAVDICSVLAGGQSMCRASQPMN